MREDAATSSVQLRAAPPASRATLVAGIVLGPLLWLVALAIAAWFFEYTWAIAVGLAVTVASFVLALLGLALVRRGRVRQERRYVDGG